MGGENQTYLVFNLNHLVKSQLFPPPLCLLTMFVSKRGRCFITLLDVTGDSTITPVTSIICIPLPIGALGKRGTLRIITPVTDCLFIHSIISFLLTLPKQYFHITEKERPNNSITLPISTLLLLLLRVRKENLIFLKHMLWVLKRTVSMRRFF